MVVGAVVGLETFEGRFVVAGGKVPVGDGGFENLGGGVETGFLALGGVFFGGVGVGLAVVDEATEKGIEAGGADLDVEGGGETAFRNGLWEDDRVFRGKL